VPKRLAINRAATRRKKPSALLSTLSVFFLFDLSDWLSVRLFVCLSQLNVLTGLLDMEAQRWGVQIQFVKVQQVTYSHNPQILSLVKDTENKNKEIIIDAKSTKQKAVIESEGQRDKMIKEAEGEANEMMANARGYSQAVRNKAAGESRTIREVAKALRDAGETNPTKYVTRHRFAPEETPHTAHHTSHRTPHTISSVCIRMLVRVHVCVCMRSVIRAAPPLSYLA
jgi:vacuolar-type H+-ATPase subunit H